MRNQYQNRTYFFDDIISIKNLDTNNIKIEKNHTKILTYYVWYVTPNSIEPLYLIINTTNGCIDENNGNKYLTIIATGESKWLLKNYEELKKFVTELQILLGQQIKTQIIMTKSI